MKSANLVLLAFLGLTAFAFCDAGKVSIHELEKELQNEYLPEDEAYESKLENNALFHRQGKTYERRRRWSNIKKVLGARKSNSGSSGGSYYDQCNRLCKVVSDGRLNCCRERKEFLSMTPEERRRYIDVYKKVSTTEPYREEYRALIQIHHDYFNTSIHCKQEFLPWHRWFVLQLENLLRKVDCNITVPYWAWTLECQDPWNSKVWSSKDGFGGNGQGEDTCVRSGEFRAGAWKPVTEDCLRRNFTDTPVCDDYIQEILKYASFTTFEQALRVDVHNKMHCNISGTMCDYQAAEAPEFFLHHAFMDKIWEDYQSRCPERRFVYFSTINTTMNATHYKPRSFIDNNKLPGGVCVVYKDTTTVAVQSHFNSKGTSSLVKQPQLVASKFPDAARKLFNLSPEQVKSAEELDLEIRQRILGLVKSSNNANDICSTD